MIRGVPHRVDLETLPRSLRRAFEHDYRVADVLNPRLRQVAFAAMARDAAIGELRVAAEFGVIRPLVVSRVVIAGVSNPNLRTDVEGSVLRTLREPGWRGGRLAPHKTWTWRLIDFEGGTASMHELAAAARAVSYRHQAPEDRRA